MKSLLAPTLDNGPRPRQIVSSNMTLLLIRYAVEFSEAQSSYNARVTFIFRHGSGGIAVVGNFQSTLMCMLFAICLMSLSGYAEGTTSDKADFSCDDFGLNIVLPPKFSIWPVVMSPACKDRTSTHPPNPQLSYRPRSRASVSISNMNKGAKTESIHVNVTPHKPGVPLLAAMQSRLRERRRREQTVNVLDPPSRIKFHGLNAASMRVNIVSKGSGFHGSNFVVREILVYNRGVSIAISHRHDHDKTPMANVEKIVWLVRR